MPETRLPRTLPLGNLVNRGNRLLALDDGAQGDQDAQQAVQAHKGERLEHLELFPLPKRFSLAQSEQGSHDAKA
jgi:hypothetical protein